MAMNVDDFKKLVETLDLPEDVKNKVFEATKDENVVPYEWKDETHLGAEVVDGLGVKYILYSVDDGIDFYGVALEEDDRPERRDACYIGRSSKNKFTGRKAILVDTKVPENADGAKIGEMFTAKVDGKDVVVQRRNGNALLWTAFHPEGNFSFEADHNVQLIHRLVEVK